MPSLQTALPPELANNVIRLYRECLRRAKYIGTKTTYKGFYIRHGNLKLRFYVRGPCILTMQYKQYNAELVVGMVRDQFKKHMHEKDPEVIQKLKDDAARGLINHMLIESEKLSGRKFSSST